MREPGREHTQEHFSSIPIRDAVVSTRVVHFHCGVSINSKSANIMQQMSSRKVIEVVPLNTHPDLQTSKGLTNARTNQQGATKNQIHADSDLPTPVLC